MGAQLRVRHTCPDMGLGFPFYAGKYTADLPTYSHRNRVIMLQLIVIEVLAPSRGALKSTQPTAPKPKNKAQMMGLIPNYEQKTRNKEMS